MTPRMQAAWEQLRAFEKKYHFETPGQSPLMVLDLIDHEERTAYGLACDEFYKASREYMRSPDIGGSQR